MQSGLSHQGKKSDCFQGNGFTAGIRTGDDQQFKILTELNVDRNDFLFIEKRMSSFLMRIRPSSLKSGCVPFIDRESCALAKIKSSFVRRSRSSRRALVSSPHLALKVARDHLDFFFFF